MTLPLGERPILGASTVMGFRPGAVAAALALVTLAALFVGAGSQAALAGATVSQDGAGWRVVYRSTSKISNIVTDVAAISPGNAWAVGSTAQAGHGNTQDEPLVLHWTGGHWRRVAVPGLAGFYLTAVAALVRIRRLGLRRVRERRQPGGCSLGREPVADHPAACGGVSRRRGGPGPGRRLAGRSHAVVHRERRRESVPDHGLSLGWQRVVSVQRSPRDRPAVHGRDIGIRIAECLGDWLIP
jgi:hypothetical protein